MEAEKIIKLESHEGSGAEEVIKDQSAESPNETHGAVEGRSRQEVHREEVAVIGTEHFGTKLGMLRLVSKKSLDPLPSSINSFIHLVVHASLL